MVAFVDAREPKSHLCPEPIHHQNTSSGGKSDERMTSNEPEHNSESTSRAAGNCMLCRAFQFFSKIVHFFHNSTFVKSFY